MTTNYFNAYTQALGALRLIPIYLDSPGVVSRATLIGAASQAIDLLDSIPCRTVELAEVFRCVNNVIHEGQTAYVTPTNSPEYPFGAVVADATGHVCAAAMGKSKEGLAELIRLKLLPPSVGLGEDAA
ncbi:hypothetical protein PUN49_15330 [Pseudomonas extremaustralis]|jgi:hypothetical protein|uniref:hypothetical protein n=1 Tax=Pseudomonas extremaustralis TaxID=359110 RepID=UPI00240ECD35|nr:hypothetical protein [Pseudomonas extremaustralis]MDG2968405.1 hypothetical protein [Pseudomonas extremaustralis]